MPFRCVPPPRGTTAQPSPGTPFFVVLLPSYLCPPGCPPALGRPPADVEARPSSRSTSHTLRHPLHVLWPRAGSSPAAVLVLYVALSQYVVYASPSSSSSGAAWWIPGGGNRLREGVHVRGAPYPHGRSGAHREHSRRGSLAPLVSPKEMKRKSQQHTMGVPMVLFRGSLSGLCLRCALLLGFAPFDAVGCLCSWCSLRPSVSCAHGLTFRWHSSLVHW